MFMALRKTNFFNFVQLKKRKQIVKTIFLFNVIEELKISNKFIFFHLSLLLKSKFITANSVNDKLYI